MHSPFKKLNFKDIGKGLIMAFISAFFTTMGQVIANRISAGIFTLSWLDIRFSLIVAGVACGSYLVKNVFTNSKGQFLKREPQKPVIK